MASVPALDLRFAPAADTAQLQDLLYAELDAFEPLAIHDHDTADGWRVFFRLASNRDAAIAALGASLAGRLLTVVAVDVDDEDWARRSQAALTAIEVGRITVAPPWDVPDARRDIVIVIDPSMGFGTGHHATTRLCLTLLQEIGVRGARVIDVGTGSGVLAIAAWRLGASSVTAMDNDPDALQNARENVSRNGAADAIEIVEKDLSSVSTAPADVVLANLTGAVLCRYARELRALTAPAGTLIVSGFSPEEIDDVSGAFGARPRATRQDGEWAAAVFGV